MSQGAGRLALPTAGHVDAPRVQSVRLAAESRHAESDTAARSQRPLRHGDTRARLQPQPDDTAGNKHLPRRERKKVGCLLDLYGYNNGVEGMEAHFAIKYQLLECIVIRHISIIQYFRCFVNL